MRTIGNILWLVLAGVWLAIGYVLAGIINCIFIITIPFGVQAFKLAGYALWPFGRMVVHRPDRDVALGCLGNAIWFVFGGIWLALGHLVAGVLLCMTVVGIPLGIACFKNGGTRSRAVRQADSSGRKCADDGSRELPAAARARVTGSRPTAPGRRRLTAGCARHAKLCP